jgi:hypothetical protein
MTVAIVGVRHHSPACARLVRDVIQRVRPRWVLVEGPCDMNGRLEELALGHALPIAIFSYRSSPNGSRGTWCPFCEYSPEWEALRAARELGARALFVDLPAWHRVFAGVENRYSDRHVGANERVRALVAELGFEDSDALWDHLFEQPQETAALERRLRDYFAALRGDEAAGDRDEPRERWMARYIAWAVAQGGDVVVVCGGFHAPALEALWSAVENGEPRLEPPGPEVRVGSYLVPYSFRRLDAFTGYESGMPSPAFHQAVWDMGPQAAPEAMLFRAVTHLRSRAQRVSPADVIAASTLAHGLGALRGHSALARVDVLDGLAGALVKDALDAPLPWTRRGVLRKGTDAMLVEMVAAFSGDRVGRLAEGTPRPPLVDHAFAELERVGVLLDSSPRLLKLELDDAAALARSRVLHRLRVLRVPGVDRTSAPLFARGQAALLEQWSVRRTVEADPALIEASLYGATLEAAAMGKLEEGAAAEADLAALADRLFEAAFCGLHGLTRRLLADSASIVGAEPSLAVLGAALARLLGLWRYDTILGAAGSRDLAAILAGAFDRGLWLFEGLTGASAPADADHVRAIAALRDCGRLGGSQLGIDASRARAVCERRATDPEAPPAMRGAALGFLWSASPEHDDALEARAIASLRASSRPAWLGDFLLGLFALAREEAMRATGLVAAMDEALTSLGREDFLVALPALRQAFTFFPPREKLVIAEAVLARHAAVGHDPMSLLLTAVDPASAREGMRIDGQLDALARRYGLDAEPHPRLAPLSGERAEPHPTLAPLSGERAEPVP